MNLKNLMTSLSIFQKYFDEGEETFAISAEHDTLYIDGTDRPISEEDLKVLIVLGWRQDVPTVKGYEFSICDYDSEMYWQYYM